MSNYRRLISYIYAYEGGVKGKNIGFAKLETRNGQCRIQVSVRKVFLGNQDMGVFLLSAGSEIFLGRIFLRNGAGEFRTSVAVDHVAGTDQNIDQCYGLTIHNMDDSWQNYTTIWEDAVAHAAEVELEEAVSELAEEKEMSQVPESVISQKKLEEAVANHKNSIVENIEAEIQAQNGQEKPDIPAQGGQEEPDIPAQSGQEEPDVPAQSGQEKPDTSVQGGQEKSGDSSRDMEEDIPSTFVQPRKEEPQKILWPRDENEQAAAPAADSGQSAGKKQPNLQERFEEQHQDIPSEGEQKLSPQQQLEKELNEETLETPEVRSESRRQERQGQEQTGQPLQEQQASSSQGTLPQGMSQSRPSRRPMQGTIYQNPVQQRQNLFQGYFSRRPVHGIPQQEQFYQGMPTSPMPQWTQEQEQMQPQPAAQLSQAMPQAAAQPPQDLSQAAAQPTWEQPAQPTQITQPSQAMPQQSQGQPVQPSQAVSPSQPMSQPMPQTSQNPASGWRQQPYQAEKEEAREGVDMETLWQRFCRTCPKLQAFDYDGNSEILTIKPQDIGLLPREIWTYGNNSFLLHGYYNHRYLILARLSTPNGGVRFLLGVPGHYYSNEKYMASMFGFPNFVMSKTQPSGDNRFGYWYTDLRLGF